MYFSKNSTTRYALRIFILYIYKIVKKLAFLIGGDDLVSPAFLLISREGNYDNQYTREVGEGPVAM